MTEKRKYPIAGTDFFTKIMDDDGYYIDKTDVIPWLLARMKQVVLFTRPRRFGKSTMMSMLKAFFEYRIDRDGNLVDNRHYFEKLKVSQDAEAMAQLGAFPVIWVTLKDVIQHSFEEALGVLANKVRVMVELCDWAWKNSSFVLDEERHQIIKHFYGGTASEKELADSIALLSGILHDVTNRNVIILIDEYDVPLQSAFLHGYYDEMLTFLRTFMSSALKTNPYLERGVITGCLRVSKESSLSGLNNVECHTIMSAGKREFFGFEPSEVKEMLHYFDLDEHYPMLEYNYDGYNFCGRHAHNPWSVIMCTRALLEGDELPYRTYWLNTSGNAVVESVIQQNENIRQKCFELLQGETIRARVSEFLTWMDLRYDSKNAWSLLTFSGYLKPVTAEDLPGDSWKCELAIPNREVKEVFAIEVGRWFSDQNPAFDVDELSDAFWDGNVERAKAQLSAALQCMSYFDSVESFYHGMLLGLLGAANRYIESNIEYGSGRLDIAVRYRDSAFVIELKSVTVSGLNKLGITREYKELDAASDDEKSRIHARLAVLAGEALQQIEDQEYAEGFMQRYPDVKSVRRYGVAFCRRWVEIAMKA
ncbi:MAG: AAA family ATPase [Proteobacteria bacterium]|nr:AAA family ATPase [Pseudomonadota bacterium]